MFGFMKTFGNYILTVSQLNDSRLWKPVLWATLLSLASLLLLLVIGGTFLFQLVDSFKDQLSGWMGWAGGWLGGLSVLLGTFFIGILGYFFLGSVYAAFLSIFLDDMLDAIREQHYPDADWIKPPGMIQSTISSLRFILFSLTLYLLASPLLLVGYFIPPVGLVLQYLLGGYLLGREYGQLIELRIPKDKRITTGVKSTCMIGTRGEGVSTLIDAGSMVLARLVKAAADVVAPENGLDFLLEAKVLRLSVFGLLMGG